MSDRGTLDRIGPAAVQRALAAVSRHEVVSLAVPIEHGGGPRDVRRIPPQHFMHRSGVDRPFTGTREKHGFGVSDDSYLLAMHGTTHIDALCHVWQDGQMYGGIPSDQVTTRGARRLGAETIGPIVTRVFIVDAVPDGLDWLPHDSAVSPQVLVEAVESTGLTPEPGDALFVRTGWLKAWWAGQALPDDWAGLDMDVLPWLDQCGFSLVGADNISVERTPSSDPSCLIPLHVALLRDRGVFLCELLDLERFAGKVTVGMLAIGVLPLVGATASPISPMVVL